MDIHQFTILLNNRTGLFYQYALQERFTTYLIVDIVLEEFVQKNKGGEESKALFIILSRLLRW